MLDFLSMKLGDRHNKIIENILTVLIFMQMNGHERGSISNAQKFNALCGDWFGTKKEKMTKEE